VGKVGHAASRPQEIRYRVKCDIAGMRFTKGDEHVCTTVTRQRRRFADQPAFPDARVTDDANDTPATGRRLLDDIRDRAHLGLTPYERRLPPAMLFLSRSDGQ